MRNWHSTLTVQTLLLSGDTLPMRNWHVFQPELYIFVCIRDTLPMRNWHALNSWVTNLNILYTWDTLPMRNWHILKRQAGYSAFLQEIHYLWGIDTYILCLTRYIYMRYITYEELTRNSFNIKYWHKISVHNTRYITYEDLTHLCKSICTLLSFALWDTLHMRNYHNTLVTIWGYIFMRNTVSIRRLNIYRI